MPGKYQIMRAIRKGLDSLEVTTSDGNPAWTKAIETKLCEIGRSFDFQVGAATVDKENRDWGAWLYDVTWLEYNDGQVVAAPLVAECEWGNFERIKDDFDKLLLARAGVRLMIYEGNRKCGSNRSKEVTDELARRIREFTDSRAEDAWLLAIYEDNRDDLPKGSDKKEWRFRYFTTWRDFPIRAFP